MGNKSQKLEIISLGDIRFWSEDEDKSNFLANDDLSMVIHGGKLKDLYLREGQIYHMAEARVVMILEGSIDTVVDLEEQTWQKGDILLLHPDTIQEVKRRSDDFDMIAVAFKGDVHVGDALHLHASASEWKELLQLMYLLWSLASHEPFRRQTVLSHIATIVGNIHDIYNAQEQRHPSAKPSSGELLFRRFRKLVSEHCDRERNVPFYAEQLYITPHHLSAVISRQSGRSVMYWINRATILRAKVLLKQGDLKTNEIADRLNFPYHSTFTNFFKRETGMSPQKYRERG